jgi:hypothetical protein
MTHDHEEAMTVRYTDEPEWDDTEVEELPRRPRRRLLRPITGALAAVVLVAVGFLAGVEVQKSEGTGTASAQGGFPRFPGGGGAGRPGAPQASESEGVQGKVASLRGSTLYVTDASGNTVRVKTGGKSEVVRTASSRPRAIHPGDTVVVQGRKNDDGSYTADQLIATADGVSVFGGFGAGGPPRGGPPGG